MKAVMSFEELDWRADKAERLAKVVSDKILEHLPELSEEERFEYAWNIAWDHVLLDDEHRPVGGVEDRAALEKYVRALYASSRARHQLPSRIKSYLGLEADVESSRRELDEIIAALQALRDVPVYKPKTNMRAADAVSAVLEVWIDVKGTTRRPTASHRSFPRS